VHYGKGKGEGFLENGDREQALALDLSIRYLIPVALVISTPAQITYYYLPTTPTDYFMVYSSCPSYYFCTEMTCHWGQVC